MKSVAIKILAGVLSLGSVVGAQDSARSDASPWGIASGAEWSGEYPRFNPMLKDAGVKWMRFFPEWQSIQPAQGQWNFEPADKLVKNCKENGIRVSGIFAFFAPWASATGDTRTGPVKDMQFWRDYVEGCVNRYKSDIQYWEVWNEFNGSFYKTLTKNKPKDYADLVSNAYDVAKKVDPGVKIGMSCANFDLGFFDLAIKAGAKGKFDFIAVHPYENLGMVMEGNESAYLSLATSIRKMLADNGEDPKMPLWITETGTQAPISLDTAEDLKQAEALVKVYVLSLAQGFDKIFWFEARGPAYGKGTDHGIIRKDWSKRPAYDALATMTKLLGSEPKYVGWRSEKGEYGFVFNNGKEDVLVTWAPPDKEITLEIPRATVTRLNGGVDQSSLPGSLKLKLTREPVFVTIADGPEALSKPARENSGKPFPWGGGFADASEVSIRMAATNVEQGIKQINPKTTEVVHLLDQSYKRSMPSRGGEGHYVYFRVDPQFATFGTKNLEITVVAKRYESSKPAVFGVTYESMSGYKGVKAGRWEIPAGEEWQEHTWTVDDANFVGGWGWNFRTDASGSRGDFVIKEVRVKKVK